MSYPNLIFSTYKRPLKNGFLPPFLPRLVKLLNVVFHKGSDTMHKYPVTISSHCQRHCNYLNLFSSVQLLNHVQLLATPWTATRQASLSITNSQSPAKHMSIESVMPSNHFILCRPLLLLPSIFPSIRVFPNESVFCIRWPQYWNFSFSISPSNEHPGLISFRIEWLDLLAVQGTLKSLLQHHSSKASVLWWSAFFIVQLSHDHWKNHSLDQTDLCWQSNVFAF